jgi:hypothetical protein
MNRRYSKSMSLRASSSGGSSPENGKPPGGRKKRRFSSTKLMTGLFAVLLSSLLLVMALGAVSNQWNGGTTGQSTSKAVDKEGRVNGRLLGVKTINTGHRERGRIFDFRSQNSRLLLNRPVRLPAQWTLSAWFKGPMNRNGRWRTLFRGRGGDHQIIIHPNGTLGSYFNVKNRGRRGFQGTRYNLLRDSKMRTGWHHVAAVGNRGMTTFYIDGRKVGTIRGQSRTDVWSLGNYQGSGQRFNRYVDDFQIDNTALTRRDILRMAKGRPPAKPVRGGQTATITKGNAQLVQSMTKLETDLAKLEGRVKVIEKWGTSLKIGAR